MTDQQPRVSVLTPAYKPKYFAEALRSVLAQTCVDFEHVICDDSPTDEIARIVQQLAGGDPRVRYVRNPGTIGGRRNYLQCFDLARGRHVKYLNDDDLLAPDCLARMSDCLDAHPKVTLVTSHRRLIDARGRRLPDQCFNRPLVREDSILAGRGLLDMMLRCRINMIGEPTTVMFRRADLASNQPHIMSFAGKAAPKNGDTFMWTSLLAQGDAAYFTAPLSSFRQHGTQVQKDPAFLVAALAAWDVLIADASAQGIFDADLPAPLDARPLDPALAARRRAQAVFLERATANMAHRDYNLAAAVYLAVAKDDPTHLEARADLGCVLWILGQRKTAIATWREVLAVDPDHLGAAVNLADALMETGQAAAAAELCGKFVLRSPWSTEMVDRNGQASAALSGAPDAATVTS